MSQIINKVEVEKYFYLTFKRLSQNLIYYPNFSGIGLILYDPSSFDHRWHADLRPSIPCPKNVKLSDMEKVVSVLFEISNKSSRLHDGFHFFDYETSLMTYVAQYFFPPIISEIDVNENYGTRYHSAQYGSCIDGVVLTGVINNDNKYHVFRNGRLIREEDIFQKVPKLG